VNDPVRVDRLYIEATREAEQGIGSCRNCGRKGAFQDMIAVLYGGGVVFSMCLPCAEVGNQIMIQRGARGIEVLQRGRFQPVGAGPILGLGILNKRTA
jgi:hypothetical protein